MSPELQTGLLSSGHGPCLEEDFEFPGINPDEQENKEQISSPVTTGLELPSAHLMAHHQEQQVRVILMPYISVPTAYPTCPQHCLTSLCPQASKMTSSHRYGHSSPHPHQ